MAKPYIHAISSAKKFGARPEDYEAIHSFMDSTKGITPTNVHRVFWHSSYGIMVLERIWFPNSCPMTADGRFPTIINSDGRHVSVRDIAEQHVLEDFQGKFIPSASDYLDQIELKSWMQNGNGVPPSFEKIERTKIIRKINLD